MPGGGLGGCRGKKITLDDGRELPCDLFLGVPKHQVPEVVVAAGLTEKGWVTVDPRTLQTPFAGVYAIGDLANSGAPRRAYSRKGAARTVAENLIAHFRNEAPTAKYPGAGSCYIEFGADRIGRVDVDFFSGPKPTGTFFEPSVALRADTRTSAPAGAHAGSAVRADPSYSAGASSSTSATIATAASALTACFAILL